MSLAQHVTATEGIDREGPEDDGSLSRGLWRPLSYDPVPPPEGVVIQEHPTIPHIAAYKVSHARRVGQVVFGTILCCLASGIVFGFASLKPVLIAEGVYGELCLKDAEEDDTQNREICPEQDMRLNLFFITASIVTNTSSLLAGYCLDRYGRRVCYTAASVFLAAGCTLLGYAFAIPEFDGYVAGNVMLALGGTFLFVPSFQLANAFPKYSGVIVAVITGAFDASAAVLLFYHMLWESSDGTFAPNQFFFGYLIVPLILIIGEWTLMPRGPYQTTPELEIKLEKAQDVTRDVHESDEEINSPMELRRVRSFRAERRQSKLSQIEGLLGDAEEREERVHLEEDRQAASGVWGVLHGLPAHLQVMTVWFILILLLTIITMLKMNYFIATIRSQYRYLLRSDEAAEKINNFFDLALPLGGIIATPFIGFLLNNLSVATSLAVLTVYVAAIGVLNCLPYMVGWLRNGRELRSIQTSILLGYVSGLDALTHGPLNGNPTPINIGMAISGTVTGVALTTYVMVKGRGHREEINTTDHHNKHGQGNGERLGLIREESYYGTMA